MIHTCNAKNVTFSINLSEDSIYVMSYGISVENCLIVVFNKGHRVLEINEETELVIDKLVFCNTHEDETLKLYCNECRDVICMMCQVVQHKLHETLTVKQALDNVLPDINQNLVELGLKLEHINEAINHTEDERKKAEKAYDKCAEEFDQKIEERIKQIRNAQKQVKEEMKKERELQVLLH